MFRRQHVSRNASVSGEARLLAISIAPPDANERI
jgi:hypothetical protein